MLTKNTVIALLLATVNCQTGEDLLFAETQSVSGPDGEKQFIMPESPKGAPLGEKKTDAATKPARDSKPLISATPVSISMEEAMAVPTTISYEEPEMYIMEDMMGEPEMYAMEDMMYESGPMDDYMRGPSTIMEEEVYAGFDDMDLTMVEDMYENYNEAEERFYDETEKI